ncbi:MAG: PH domain-containing protein [Nanoarchaeota archaeon]
MKKKRIYDGEILKVRNSRKLYIPFYLMIIFLIIFLSYIKFSNRPISDISFKLVLAFIILVIIVTEIHRLGNFYEVNDKSIIHTNGYFWTISKRIEFGAISDIDILQGPWQRMMKFGNIVLFKFSEGPILKNINRPKDFVDYLQTKMRGFRARGPGR